MTLENPPKRGRGRPKKSEIAAAKKNPVGRPRSDNTIINEYKARMLASPKSRQVLEAIYSAALDDEHKNQAAAWKLLMDRVLPLSYFEKDKDPSSGRPTVSISITGFSGSSEPPTIDATDVEDIRDEE